jgi:hypothetical protein
MITDLNLLTTPRDYFDWKNVAESLVLWSHKIEEALHFQEVENHIYCGESPAEGSILWAFLDRGHTQEEILREIQDVWPRILPGGILAGHDYRDANWPEVAPTVDDWAAENGLTVHFSPPHSFWIRRPGGSYPEFSIWNQQVLPQVPVEHAYNPTICAHPRERSKRIFAFRSNVGKWEDGRIWIGNVDALDLQFISPPRQLDLEVAEMNCEDPRLFSFDGEIWLGYTVSDWSSGRTISRMRLVSLDETPAGEWACCSKPVAFASPFGRAQEKNWIFHAEHDDRLLVHYSSYPEWRIHQLFTDAPDEYVEKVVAPTLSWPYGDIRGGTPFFKAPNGNWWTFFHSSMWHSPEQLPEPVSYYNGAFPEDLCRRLAPSREALKAIGGHGRYFCGLLEVCAETLLPGRISRQPLLYQTPPSEGRCGNHVIWPAGAFREDDNVFVAYGLDDRTSHCCRFSCEELERLLEAL